MPQLPPNMTDTGGKASPSDYPDDSPYRTANGPNWTAGYWNSVYGCLPDGWSLDDADLNPSLDDSCDWFE